MVDCFLNSNQKLEYKYGDKSSINILDSINNDLYEIYNINFLKIYPIKYKNIFTVDYIKMIYFLCFKENFENEKTSFLINLNNEILSIFNNFEREKEMIINNITIKKEYEFLIKKSDNYQQEYNILNKKFKLLEKKNKEIELKYNSIFQENTNLSNEKNELNFKYNGVKDELKEIEKINLNQINKINKENKEIILKIKEDNDSYLKEKDSYKNKYKIFKNKLKNINYEFEKWTKINKDLENKLFSKEEEFKEIYNKNLISNNIIESNKIHLNNFNEKIKSHEKDKEELKNQNSLFKIQINKLTNELDILKQKTILSIDIKDKEFFDDNMEIDLNLEDLNLNSSNINIENNGNLQKQLEEYKKISNITIENYSLKLSKCYEEISKLQQEILDLNKILNSKNIEKPEINKKFSRMKTNMVTENMINEKLKFEKLNNQLNIENKRLNYEFIEEKSKLNDSINLLYSILLYNS